MKLRIHHFFDILRDFGSGKPFIPHPFQHAYHAVAEEIWNNPHLLIELVVSADAVCSGCIHLVGASCDDVITHRADFRSKEAFNNHLDRRIMKICGLQTSACYSPVELCRYAGKYIEHMDFIYAGNDKSHTLERTKNVIKGLDLYVTRHQLEK